MPKTKKQKDNLLKCKNIKPKIQKFIVKNVKIIFVKIVEIIIKILIKNIIL